MTFQTWLLYIMVVLAATGTPGPAVLFIMTHSVLMGWRRMVFAALGNIAGLFCLGIMAVTGLGALLKASEMIFNLVKFTGALYLIYLGIRSWLASRHSGEEPVAASGEAKSSRRLFAEAWALAMSNPKAILFLTALFPQFINPDQRLMPQFSILIVTLMSFSFLFLMSYALLAHRAGAWLNRPSRLRLLKRSSGSLYIGFGVLLAVSTRK